MQSPSQRPVGAREVDKLRLFDTGFHNRLWLCVLTGAIWLMATAAVVLDRWGASLAKTSSATVHLPSCTSPAVEARRDTKPEVPDGLPRR